MKKITSVLCLVLFVAVAASAQEFKKFRVGLGGGYAIPGGTGSKGGLLIYLDPSYRITDQILAGVRFEFAGMVRGFADDVNTSGVDVSFSGSNTLFGQYYFNNNNFRPFVGVGFGLFNVASASVSSANGGDVYEAVDESKFGFYPRVGFDAGHFTLSLDYNLVGPSTARSLNSNNTIETKNSYIGIRIGGFFGGGRK